MRPLYYFAIADFKERSRQYGFIVTLILILYLGYITYQSDVIIMLGQYRGESSAAWAGNLMALAINTFLGLGGFYLIKNSIKRDVQTGVGQIIATTPTTKFTYLLGKWLSHIFLLVLILTFLFLATLILQLISSDTPGINYWQLFAPFFFLSFPLMAFLGGITLFFEATPVLRNGVGNIVYFFIFMIVLLNSFEAFNNIPWISDPLGLQLVSSSMETAAVKAFPDLTDGFSFLVEKKEILGYFLYEGITWSFQNILSRFVWIIFGLILVCFAALIHQSFIEDHHNSTKKNHTEIKNSKKEKSSQPTLPSSTDVPFTSAQAPPLSRLTRRSAHFVFGRIWQSELILLVRGYPWWTYVLCLGLNFAAIFSPLSITQAYLLPIAWGIPILLWSKMGCRESEFNTHQLINSTPKLLIQWLAVYFSGLTITALCGMGALISFVYHQSPEGILGWFAATVFIPSLAWFLGTLSGTPRAFEIIYAFIWFFGPIQQLPMLDFIGAVSIPSQKLLYLGGAIVMLIITLMGRHYRFRHL
ncbi:MAG: hypothetical protein JEZ06_21350 [Anaerolineaceae bacterium]|nr:hypothetical protein [Anaerolineaceae bacterium]